MHSEYFSARNSNVKLDYFFKISERTFEIWRTFCFITNSSEWGWDSGIFIQEKIQLTFVREKNVLLTYEDWNIQMYLWNNEVLKIKYRISKVLFILSSILIPLLKIIKIFLLLYKCLSYSIISPFIYLVCCYYSAFIVIFVRLQTIKWWNHKRNVQFLHKQRNENQREFRSKFLNEFFTFLSKHNSEIAEDFFF